jgi:elongation factor Ts
MTKVSANQVKKLREETGAGVMDARRALMESGGDFDEAKKVLKAKGAEAVEKKAERTTSHGLIETYTHAGGKVGSMVFLACETDFVAKTDEFKKLAKEVVMQVAAMDPKNTDELLKQEYIRDPGKTVKDLVDETVAKTGENIQVKKVVRFALGE